MDIAWPNLERGAVQRDAVRGVGWLTTLCQPFVERLGGIQALRDQLKAPVELSGVGNNGWLIQAGPQPVLGGAGHESELEPYQHVYRTLSPLIELAVPRYPTFPLKTERRAHTSAWLRRLS
jgi:hypothetical protein